MGPNHHHHHNLTLNNNYTATIASSSSSYHIFYPEDNQEVAYAHPFIESKPLLHTHEVVGDVAMERKKKINGLKRSILTSYKQDNHNGSNSPTPLKMRLFQKTMKSNDDYQTNEDQNSKQVHCPSSERCENRSHNTDSCGLIRACVDCGTTTTPLWRSGPNGPKSLCNACGIRQRKARRAAMAASETTCATNSNTSTTSNSNSKLNTEMRAPKKMKKRSKKHAKIMAHDDHQRTETKRICFQEFALDLSKKLSLHQSFPQDEKEAAILLMALSCGFVEE